MAKYTVGLNTESALFDNAEFGTLEEAIAFSRGRGGVYSVQLSSGDPMGEDYRMCHLSYDSDEEKFSLDGMCGWETITDDKLIDTLKAYLG